MGNHQAQASAWRVSRKKKPQVAGLASALACATGTAVMPITSMFCPSLPRLRLTTGNGGTCAACASASGV